MFLGVVFGCVWLFWCRPGCKYTCLYVCWFAWLICAARHVFSSFVNVVLHVLPLQRVAATLSTKNQNFCSACRVLCARFRFIGFFFLCFVLFLLCYLTRRSCSFYRRDWLEKSAPPRKRCIFDAALGFFAKREKKKVASSKVFCFVTWSWLVDVW